MRMTTNIVLPQSFAIPEETSSLEVQIATLKLTLCKLNMLNEEVKGHVSLGMLKYMQSLDSPEKAAHKEYILGELTETELEGLLSLVEFATQQLKMQESQKSATLPSRSAFPPIPPGGIVGGLTTGGVVGVTSGLSYKDYEKLNWIIQQADNKETRGY